MHPADLLAQHRCWFTGDTARAEVEADHAVGVGMFGHEQFFPDHSDHAKFFVQFAGEACFVRLTRLALATWELPHSGEMRAVQAARDQKPPVVGLDDRGKHDDDLACGSHDPALAGPRRRFAGGTVIG